MHLVKHVTLWKENKKTILDIFKSHLQNQTKCHIIENVRTNT